MNAPGHVMILASAGSGKTYALTNRFVGLLAAGAKPERIVALTFTRKAAGEFFDEILKKLARAASDADFAAGLARELGRPAMTARDFLGHLRAVIEAMPRLQLGTLDGFFARIAVNFPFELGLAGDFEILEDHAAKVERTRVLRRLFARSGELDEAQRGFIEAFKRATFGLEEKRLGARLDAFLDEHHGIFLEAPQADLWGNPRRIWPRGVDWLGFVEGRANALCTLEQEVAGLDLNEKQRERWALFFEDAGRWAPGAEPGKGMAYLLKNVLEAWPALDQVVIERKKVTLPPAVREALRAAVSGMIGAEFQRCLESTRGIHAVLAGYDAVYHDRVRRAGRLTFADLQRLLQPSGSGAAPLSGEAGEDRLYIDYRLDGGADHWLLDEFQDTSFGQWSILRPLIDEVVQDPTRSRSFFYVGDVKQAIFGWREGDPRLFREIFDHYNANGEGTISERHLVQSWRSGPAVIDTVNRVFGAAAVFSEHFPGPASAAWNREWREHVSARPALGGHVAWLHAADRQAGFAVTRDLIERIAPLERGLTCAVLVRRNATATELADFLRREAGIPAVAESDLHVCTDNPLGRVLLALAKAAAHPGDSLARELLLMTPLAGLLAEDALETPEALTRRVLGDIHAEGFERWAAHWLRRIEPHLDRDDRFSRDRGRQWLEAAALFDATGSRDVAEFIRFMESHAVRENEAGGAVRVMTIHKSKGLGFDVVILPDLEGNRLDTRRDGLAVKKSADREVEWVYDLPKKAWAECDPVLSACMTAAEADACYEAFSLLYVAMTRAKRGLYLVSKPAGRSVSRNFVRILADTLGEEPVDLSIGGKLFAGSFESGDPGWYEEIQAGATAAPPEPIRTVEAGGGQRRLEAHRASSGKDGEWGGATLFDLEGGRSAEFGTLLHLLFAEISSVPDESPQKWAERWRERGEPALAVREAVACLESRDLAEVWRGGASVEVWRERAFEIVLDDRWVSGVVDRVALERDAEGRPCRATVFDFKTDAVADDEGLRRATERHRLQMDLYRRVVARLTGLAGTDVRAALVYTVPRSLVYL